MSRHHFITISALLLLMLLISSSTSAQSYYPLQVGNRWVYRDTSYGVGGGNSSGRSIYEIINDTLMSNGHKYFQFKNYDAIGGKFVREDTNWIHYYNSQSKDVPFFKLNASINEKWNTNLLYWFSVQLIEEGFVITFADTLNVKKYLLDGISQMYVYLSQKYGPIVVRDLHDPPGVYITDQRLIGAIIADSVYGIVLSAKENKERIIGFSLSQNYPNPFNPNTSIEITVPRQSTAKLVVFDMLGREIETLFSGLINGGTYSINWTPKNITSGFYLYRFQTTEYTKTMKMLFIK